MYKTILKAVSMLLLVILCLPAVASADMEEIVLEDIDFVFTLPEYWTEVEAEGGDRLIYVSQSKLGLFTIITVDTLVTSKFADDFSEEYVQDWIRGEFAQYEIGEITQDYFCKTFKGGKLYATSDCTFELGDKTFICQYFALTNKDGKLVLLACDVQRSEASDEILHWFLGVLWDNLPEEIVLALYRG